MGVQGRDSAIYSNEISDGANIKIEPLIENFVDSLNNYFKNNGYPKLVMDDRQKKEIYDLAVKPFVEKDLTILPLKGDPKILIKKLEVFGECCAESYKTVGAEDYCRFITKALIAGEVSNIKYFANSGSYSHLNIEDAVKKSINLVVGEAYNHQKSNPK